MAVEGQLIKDLYQHTHTVPCNEKALGHREDGVLLLTEAEATDHKITQHPLI
jgi:hypothetical protein